MASVALALFASIASAQTKPPKPVSLDDILSDAAKPKAGAPDAPRSPRNPVMPLVPLTLDETRAIGGKIRPCWNPVIGPMGTGVVPVMISGIVGADGLVISAKVADDSRMGDPSSAAHANAALRAVNSHRCQPWPLMAQKQGGDRSFSFVFDLRSR